MKKLLLMAVCFTTVHLNAQTLTVTANPTNVTCNGANNGSATINVSGCSGNPTYVWTPNVSTTNSASNLAPGSYTVNVTTPGTGGTQTLFNDDFSTTTNWTLNTTTGTNGGTANTWVINSASPASGTCSGSAAGGNSLHITCGGGFLCSLIAPNGEAVYNAGGAANITDKTCVLVNNVSTVGLTNIQVSFLWLCNGEGSNDYANLRYSIDGGTNWTDLSTIYSGNSSWTCATVTLPAACENISTLKIGFRWRNNGNNAGTDPPMNIDNVRITGTGSGGSGCSGSVTFNITQPAALTVSASSQTNVACNGAATGAVTVAANGGSSGYQYKIGNGSYQPSGTFNGLAAGTYTITVQDANNCTATTTVTITQPATPLSVSVSTQTNTNCGGSTGSVTVSGSGGAPSYQYKIGNGNYQISPTFTGLAAGTYTITILDANNCTSTTNVTIVSPSGLTVASQNQTNVTCFGAATGSVTVAGANGTPSYQYKIGNGSYQPSGTFNGLAAGTYTITVLDGNNCTATTTVTITQPASAVTANISSQTNASCGNNNGSVTIVATGGTSGYQYKIGNGNYQPSPTFSGLAGGNYVITIQDNNGCTTTVNVTINSTNGVNISATPTNVTCNGLANGSVVATPTGGTPGYQYSIDGVNFQGSSSFSNLGPGVYTVTIQDNAGCTDTAQFNIIEPAPYIPVTNYTGNVGICEGEQIDIMVTGNTGNNCLWSNNSFSSMISVTNPGTYNVTCQDNNGCEGTSADIVVTVTPLPLASFNNQQINNYAVNFINSSTNATSYLWLFPGNNTSTEAEPQFNFPSEGNYSVTLIASNDCGSDTLVQIVGVDKLASIEENSLAVFNLYPNPANADITLQMESFSPLKARIQIINALGQIVYAEGLNFSGSYVKTIDASTLTSGIYIVAIQGDSLNINRKLVIKK